MLRSRVLALVIGLSACAAEPEVQVRMRVGPEPDPTDERDEVGVGSALEVLRGAVASLTPTPTATAGPAHVVRPPRTSDELGHLIKAVRTAPLDEIAGPARRIAAATDPAVWPQIEAALLRPRKSPKGDYRSLLAAIGGDVPNKYGYFKLAWKRAHGHRVKLSEDWFEDLLALPRTKVSRPLRRVYRDCVLQTALMRAASGIARSPDHAGDAVAALIDVAYIHAGTFRDEAGRSLRAVGDEAVPHLIRASLRPSQRKRDEDSIPVRKARYAEYQLDRMDRLHPSRAVAAVGDSPRLLAAVLAAYGHARVGEAAAVLLDHADAPSPAVRGAARTSLLAYVTGPPPRAVTRTVRTLGGGTKSTRAYLSYRQRAALALRQRLESQAPELLEEPCDRRREDGTIDEHCEQQPLRHAQAYLAWLDGRREDRERQTVAAALSSDDRDAAMVALDRVLAVNPRPHAATDMIAFYRAASDAALASGDATRAGQLLRKSAMLAEPSDPALAEHLTVQALLAEAQSADLPDAGRDMLLRSARVAAPDDRSVAAASASSPGMGPDSADVETWSRVVGGVALVGLCLACLIRIGRPVRRRLLLEESRAAR